jgi:hypothetical protein
MKIAHASELSTRNRILVACVSVVNKRILMTSLHW